MGDRSRRIRVALLAITVGAAQAAAQDALPPRFSFGGFGSFGAVHSDERRGDFATTIFKPDGAGYTHAWSADVDSLMGVQATVRVTRKLSAVVQLVSEQKADDTYWPHVEWANVQYQVTPDLSVRLGRTVLPGFLLSETRKVGYISPWVRPPLEVYRLLPVTTSDGIDVSYRRRIGSVSNTVQGNFGRSDTKGAQDGDVAEARRAWGVSYSAEYGPWTARAYYKTADLTIKSVEPFFEALRQFGPEGIALADQYDVSSKPFPFVGFGLSFEPAHWFAMAEWGHGDAHSFLGKRTAWYVSGGHRRGRLTPYLTYAQSRADNLSDPGLTTDRLPPPLAGPAMGLNAVLNSLLRSKVDQSTASVGARWDFPKNTALTLQLDRTRIGAGSSGVLINVQPDFPPDGATVHLLSATIDVVF